MFLRPCLLQAPRCLVACQGSEAGRQGAGLAAKPKQGQGSQPSAPRAPSHPILGRGGCSLRG